MRAVACTLDSCTPHSGVVLESETWATRPWGIHGCRNQAGRDMRPLVGQKPAKRPKRQPDTNKEVVGFYMEVSVLWSGRARNGTFVLSYIMFDILVEVSEVGEHQGRSCRVPKVRVAAPLSGSPCLCASVVLLMTGLLLERAHGGGHTLGR
jgi:hypothetical protein